jgi:hypothetical protein
VVAFDSIVGVLLGVVERVGCHFLDDRFEGLSEIGHDLLGRAVRGDSGGEEPAGRGDITPYGDVHVDDLEGAENASAVVSG